MVRSLAILLQAAGRGNGTQREAGRLAALVGEGGKALGLLDLEVRLQRKAESPVLGDVPPAEVGVPSTFLSQTDGDGGEVRGLKIIGSKGYSILPIGS